MAAVQGCGPPKMHVWASLGSCCASPEEETLKLFKGLNGIKSLKSLMLKEFKIGCGADLKLFKLSLNSLNCVNSRSKAHAQIEQQSSSIKP